MKLEVGKKYVCRNGEVVGPMVYLPDSCEDIFPFLCIQSLINGDKKWFMPNGAYYTVEDPWDIVSEYTEPAPPLQWKWMKPDRTGVWAFGGISKPAPDLSRDSIVVLGSDYGEYVERWCCWICDVPVIAPPKKQRVMKHLWVRRSGDGPRDIETEWSEKCPGDNWYCSSLAEEFIE